MVSCLMKTNGLFCSALWANMSRYQYLAAIGACFKVSLCFLTSSVEFAGTADCVMSSPRILRIVPKTSSTVIAPWSFGKVRSGSGSVRLDRGF